MSARTPMVVAELSRGRSCGRSVRSMSRSRAKDSWSCPCPTARRRSRATDACAWTRTAGSRVVMAMRCSLRSRFLRVRSGSRSGRTEKSSLRPPMHPIRLRRSEPLQLSRFVNRAGLVRIGASLYRRSQESGAPIDGSPGDLGFGTLQQSSLERSNVDFASELRELARLRQRWLALARACGMQRVK